MKSKLVIFIFLAFDVIIFLWLLLHGHNIALFNSKGEIALKERELISFTVLLGLSVIIPVLILTFFVAWKYREGNSGSKYTPDSVHNKFLEFAWWALPTAIILILGVVNWRATHALDPYKTLDVASKPVTIQVVALRWKWLFIYPEQNIATVNFIQFPAQTPINFELTADAPMSSFWIPNLGGQIYAMTGMESKLHLIADLPGDFRGSAAEINGPGFSGMKFMARASSQADFDTWVQEVKNSGKTLDLTEYNKLASPSENNPVTFYASTDVNLYNNIIRKFMAQPESGSQNAR